MRVVAGEARGRLLRAPAGRVTRPTTDRVRESMFNMVDSATDLAGAEVTDLFAGSGALGIEALSRGAAHATFVESDRLALGAIAANLAALGTGPERSTVVRGDALRWAAGRPRPGGAPVPVGERIVLADPPYRFEQWPELLGALTGWATLVVLESGAPLELGPGWRPFRERRYGATVVTIARPSDPPISPATPKGGM